MFGQILLHLLVFLLYSVAISAALFLLPPLIGLAVGALVFAGVLRLYLLRAPRRVALRLERLQGPLLGWTLAATPVLIAIAWALGELYLSLVPVPERVLNPFGPLILHPHHRLSIAVLAIAVAPVVEEMFFRGLIQQPLERRWGPAVGIGVAALLFALVHVDTLPWVMPIHLFLGGVFGWAVYVTRSIWAGVILHAANNASALLGLRIGDDPLTRPTIWEAGIDASWWQALALLIVATAAAAWVAKRLRAAAAARPEPAAGALQP